MKRFLLAALFFAVLLLIWEVLFRAKIWSPVLLPSPRQVAVYLEGAAVDGTLVKATIVTMRRLLIGYIIGLVARAAVGIADCALEGVAGHHWNASPWSPDIAECLLGPACVVVVRTDGSRYAFRGSNGHALVGSHRNGNWRAQRAANLQSCCSDHGLQASAHVVQGYSARGASVYR